MRTATERNAMDIERAIKMHRTDLRARQIIDMCTANAMNETGEPDEYNYRGWASDVTRLAVATLLRYIYKDDAEINRLMVERDHYKRLAEHALNLAPPSVAIALITGAASIDPSANLAPHSTSR